jgi:hypothetical protein
VEPVRFFCSVFPKIKSCLVMNWHVFVLSILCNNKYHKECERHIFLNSSNFVHHL